MSGISLTASMRSNLLSLQNIASQQDIVQNRLATGLKVSSAIDNPSSYYTASSLNNRAADLTALLDAMSQGIQTIKAASEAIESGTKFLEQAKAVANQALETAQPVIARVSNEAELLAAIDSGQRGLIVAEGTITLSDNTSLYLKDGQSLVGARYLDKTAAETTINFNFDGIIDNGIEAGNNSLISDLNINLTANTRSNFRHDSDEKAVIQMKNKQDIKLSNLNIDVDTSTASEISGFFSVKVIESSAEISGNINISVQGKYTRGIMAWENSSLEFDNAYVNGKTSNGDMLLQSYYASEINVGGSSEINLSGEIGSHPLYLFGSGKINFNDFSTLNISVNDRYSVGAIRGSGGGGTITFRDNSCANLQSLGTNSYCISGVDFIIDDNARVNLVGNGGFHNSHIFLKSAQAVLNLGTTLAFCTTSTQPVYLSAAAGTRFATTDGLYTAPQKAEDLLINNSSLMASFILDSSKPAVIEDSVTDMFADFDNHMAENRGDDEDTANSSEEQYSEIISQYDSLIRDASYKGVNLLTCQKLKINFNEDRSSKIDVPGVKADSESLGLKTKVWQTAEDVEKSVSELEEAIGSLRSFASEFGNYYSIVTTRQDFTENLINVLEEGADKLTLADMNQESANMLALQTAQQLAVNSLSLASQASQAVLKLF